MNCMKENWVLPKKHLQEYLKVLLWVFKSVVPPLQQLLRTPRQHGNGALQLQEGVCLGGEEGVGKAEVFAAGETKLLFL